MYVILNCSRALGLITVRITLGGGEGTEESVSDEVVFNSPAKTIPILEIKHTHTKQTPDVKYLTKAPIQISGRDRVQTEMVCFFAKLTLILPTAAAPVVVVGVGGVSSPKQATCVQDVFP